MENNQTPKADSPSPTLAENFRKQVLAGPLPQAVETVKQEIRRNRAKLFLIVFTFIFLGVIILGLIFGTSLGKLFGPKPITVSEIPAITPTVTAPPPSSFDSLRDRVRSFSGVLPDPAPPAVDNSINLQPTKR